MGRFPGTPPGGKGERFPYDGQDCFSFRELLPFEKSTSMVAPSWIASTSSSSGPAQLAPKSGMDVEAVHPLAVLGTVLVLLGARITSRREG